MLWRHVLLTHLVETPSRDAAFAEDGSQFPINALDLQRSAFFSTERHSTSFAKLDSTRLDSTQVMEVLVAGIESVDADTCLGLEGSLVVFLVGEMGGGLRRWLGDVGFLYGGVGDVVVVSVASGGDGRLRGGSSCAVYECMSVRVVLPYWGWGCGVGGRMW